MPLNATLKALILTVLLSCTSNSPPDPQPAPPPHQASPQLHTAGLQLPESPSAIRYACEWPCGNLLEVGTNGILLNGEVVLHLEKGATKPADLKGFLLPNLLVHLDNQRELEKKIAPDSDMIIFLAVDSRTPWKTAVQVMYTAGQAGLNSLLFVVDSQSAPQAQSDENPTSKSLWVGRDVHNPLTLARVNGEATPISIAELGEKTRQLLGAEALGCWVVQGPSPSSFGAFASVAGSLIAVRPQKIFLVDAATAPNGVAQPNETATDSKSPLPLKDGALAVIRIDLPEIGLPGNTPLPECSPGGVFQSGMSPAENVFRERDRAPGN